MSKKLKLTTKYLNELIEQATTDAYNESEQAGGFFIPNPKTKPHSQQLIPFTNSIVQEFADMLGAIAVAAADNVVSKDEAKAIRRRWEDLKSVTEGFVASSEEGNFATIKQEASTRDAKSSA